jgi:hypothetical protein
VLGEARADLEARLERLHLHWVTFDTLFDGMVAPLKAFCT